jgi:hypothetical protein
MRTSSGGDEPLLGNILCCRKLNGGYMFPASNTGKCVYSTFKSENTKVIWLQSSYDDHAQLRLVFSTLPIIRRQFNQTKKPLGIRISKKKRGTPSLSRLKIVFSYSEFGPDLLVCSAFQGMDVRGFVPNVCIGLLDSYHDRHVKTNSAWFLSLY